MSDVKQLFNLLTFFIFLHQEVFSGLDKAFSSFTLVFQQRFVFIVDLLIRLFVMKPARAQYF